MTSPVMDRGRFPPTLWRAMRSAGLDPPKVLRMAGLPSTLHLDASATLSTRQLFAIWKALEALADDPAVALRLLRGADACGHQPAFISALYASDFRDAIGRIQRFKRLGACEVFRTEEANGRWTIIKEWPFATEAEPAASVDLSFMFLLELGRRGTGRPLTPARIEYRRSGPASPALETYYGAPVVFSTSRNAMTFYADDLAAAFPGHSPEFLALVTPGLAAAFAEINDSHAIADRVKSVLKRLLASGRPEVAHVARDLGMSERTLQRRITADATTFRALLSDARRELSQQLLADPALHLDEVSYLLGYQDTTSFYRAFKAWAGVSPGAWRSGPGTRSQPQRGCIEPCGRTELVSWRMAAVEDFYSSGGLAASCAPQATARGLGLRSAIARGRPIDARANASMARGRALQDHDKRSAIGRVWMWRGAVLHRRRPQARRALPLPDLPQGPRRRLQPFPRLRPGKCRHHRPRRDVGKLPRV